MPLPGRTFTGDIFLGTHSLIFTNTSAVVRTINQAMLEALYTGSSTWITSSALSPYVTNSTLTTTLGSYMPLSGGTFTGDISLGTHSLKFTNASAVVRTINQTMLEALYTSSSTWITTSALTPNVTSSTLATTLGGYLLMSGGTFTGDILGC